MRSWLRLARGIDILNERLGRWIAWLAVLMVLLGAYNAVVRYLGKFTGTSLSANVYLEAQWYLFTLLFLLGAAYTLKHNAHVRVDVIYGRLSPRAQAWVNLLGALVFLIPFCVFGIVTAWPAVVNSWTVLETSPDPGGLPRYPIKTMIPVAFLLLILQGVSEAVKQIAFLRAGGESEAESWREGV